MFAHAHFVASLPFAAFIGVRLARGFQEMTLWTSETRVSSFEGDFQMTNRAGPCRAQHGNIHRGHAQAAQTKNKAKSYTKDKFGVENCI